MHLEPWCGGWRGGTESNSGKWEIKAKNRSGASSSNNRFEIAVRIGHLRSTNLVLGVTWDLSMPSRRGDFLLGSSHKIGSTREGGTTAFSLQMYKLGLEHTVLLTGERATREESSQNLTLPFESVSLSRNKIYGEM